MSRPLVEPGNGVEIDGGPWVGIVLSITIGVVLADTGLVVSEIIGGIASVVAMLPVDPNVIVATVSVGTEGIGALETEFTDTGTVTTVVNGIVPADPSVIVVTVLVGSDVTGRSVALLAVDPGTTAAVVDDITPVGPNIIGVEGSVDAKVDTLVVGTVFVVSGLLDAKTGVEVLARTIEEGSPTVDPTEGSGTCELLARMIEEGLPAVDPTDGFGSCELLAGTLENGIPVVDPTESVDFCGNSEACVVTGKIIEGNPPVDATEGAIDTLNEGCSVRIVAVDSIGSGTDEEPMLENLLDEDSAVWIGTEPEASTTEDCDDTKISVLVAIEEDWLLVAEVGD